LRHVILLRQKFWLRKFGAPQLYTRSTATGKGRFFEWKTEAGFVSGDGLRGGCEMVRREPRMGKRWSGVRDQTWVLSILAVPNALQFKDDFGKFARGFRVTGETKKHHAHRKFGVSGVGMPPPRATVLNEERGATSTILLSDSRYRVK
jgi:hypothetical protein